MDRLGELQAFARIVELGGFTKAGDSLQLSKTTVSDLVQRTADELLGSRNFGVTSLNEVRAKRTELGLKLRND